MTFIACFLLPVGDGEWRASARHSFFLDTVSAQLTRKFQQAGQTKAANRLPALLSAV